MSHTLTLTTETTFVIEDCCSCGIQFGMPADHVKNLRRDHSWFYCPNGHTQHYTAKSDAELRREAERKAASAIEDARIARMEADEARMKLRKAEAEAKRIAKRSAAGVCPCCNRSFVQLARHMKSQHPNHGQEQP